MGGAVTVRLNLNATGYSAEMAKAQRTMQGFTSATSAMGHGTVSSMQAASASIRLIEGDMTRNVRAVERFITMIPGVGAALKAAFPLVGAAALAGIVYKIGEEALAAIKKIEQMPVAIQSGFRQMNIGAETSIDNLRLGTAKMQEQIDLLSGKRPNTLAEDLANAALAADKLATSLDADNQKITELLKNQHLGGLAGLFTHNASTSDVEGSVNSFDQQMADLAARLQHATRTGDPNAIAIQKELDDKRTAALQWQRQQLAQRSAPQSSFMNQGGILAGTGVSGPDQSANMAILRGFGNTLTDQQDQEAAEKENKAVAARLKQLEDAKKFAELQKQAQGQLVQQWHKNLDEERTTFDNVLVQEGQFWVQRMESARKGSLSYIAALDEANKIIARMREENMRGQKEFNNTAAKAYLPDDLSKGDTGTMQEQGRQTVDYLKALNEGISIHRQSANAIAEESIQMEVLTGRMSRLDAAQAMAALHAQEYQQAQTALQAALANANSLPDSISKQATIAGLNNQGAQMDAQRQMQVAGDQQKVADQTLGPALQQALGTMANQWTNMTQSIVQIVTRGIDSLNDDIAKLATGQGKKGDFAHTFSQAGEGLVKTGLQSAEGNILKAFHVGSLKKADGSQNNPFYVIPAGQGGTGGGAGGTLPAFVRPFIGGQPQARGGPSGGAQQGGGSIWGQLLKAFLPGLKMGGGAGSGGGPVDYDGYFQGAFSGGGDVVAGRPALVGEAGAEIFTPKTAGTITPNDRIGGSTGHTFNIDARGSNDPAAVHAAVMRAAPHIAAAGVQATHQNRMRSPGGR